MYQAEVRSVVLSLAFRIARKLTETDTSVSPPDNWSEGALGIKIFQSSLEFLFIVNVENH